MTALVVPAQHRLRLKTELFIREVYSQEYGATIGTFPPTLMVILDKHGDISCAAGLRSSTDGFFSECYLGSSIEAMLTRWSGEHVRRDSIFEISTFASRAPNSVNSFISQIIDYGEASGFDWAFFTLTRRLRLLLDRIGLELTPIASADISRVPDPSAWGSYYEKDPKVFAGNRDSLSALFRSRHRIAVNA